MLTENTLRNSPVYFSLEPRQTKIHDGWRIVLSYGKSEGGTKLVDLSHCRKWDLQDSDLTRFKPFGLPIPGRPGECIFQSGVLISRMNKTQGFIWQLKARDLAAPFPISYTELTDGRAILAVSGEQAFKVMERLTSLDVANPSLKAPCLIQGPVLDVPCQIVVLIKDNQQATILISFSSGYGHCLTEAFLTANADLGLEPGGLNSLAFLS